MINRGLTGEFEWLNKRFLVVGVSGGKDSLALALYLKSKDIDYTPVFLDTGHEHQDTIDYVNNYLINFFPNLVVLKNENLNKKESAFKGGFEQAVAQAKMFPSSKMRFCTKTLKIDPLIKYLNEMRYKTRSKPVNAVGIRKQESQRRSKLNEIEEQDEATIWRAIIEWKVEDVISIIKKNGFKPNPLYLRGMDRVGCYPCIYESKHNIRYISLTDPERIEYIDDLEQRVNKLREKEDKKEKSYFFYRQKKPMPIHDVVAWSKNKIDNDVEEHEETGCMRWGLCESAQQELFNIEN